LYIGFKYVKKAQEHFEKNDGTPFTSKVIGTDVEIWDKKTGPAFSKP
jgi:AGCS family alanine or glycine:cation symporter